MNERDETRLRDMLDAAKRARKFIEGKTRATLEDDDMLLGFAVVRAIEVVAEAASKISAETRAALPRIRWHEIIGMRNRIIHDYLNVDYNVVWDVANHDLPDMISELEKFVPPEPSN